MKCQRLSVEGFVGIASSEKAFRIISGLRSLVGHTKMDPSSPDTCKVVSYVLSSETDKIVDTHLDLIAGNHILETSW